MSEDNRDKELYSKLATLLRKSGMFTEILSFGFKPVFSRLCDTVDLDVIALCQWEVQPCIHDMNA